MTPKSVAMVLARGVGTDACLQQSSALVRSSGCCPVPDHVSALRLVFQGLGVTLQICCAWLLMQAGTWYRVKVCLRCAYPYRLMQLIGTDTALKTRTAEASHLIESTCACCLRGLGGMAWAINHMTLSFSPHIDQRNKSC